MSPQLTYHEWVMVIDALRDAAATTAGLSQKPDLYAREDFLEWDLAQRIEDHFANLPAAGTES